MTYIEGRTIFRNELNSLFEPNEIDFYFKTILKSLFKIEPTAIALEPNQGFSKRQEQQLKTALKQLLQEKPLQYITGVSYFRDLTVVVNPSVLIPRPETEELVDWVLEDHDEVKQDASLLDFGTGSGCIAIALANEQPKFKVLAADVDSSVLETAEQNAVRNNAKVTFLKQDILSLETLNMEVDVIVSNPPYIPPSEQIEMKSNVLDFEPHLALFVPENDPLIFYRSILDYGVKKLTINGFIYFEINPRFLSEMKSLILSFGIYSVAERKDAFGKVRMLRVQK